MIYDCFIFSNEVELLKLRLTELWDVVDSFVLVESGQTHRGNQKPLYYSDNKSKFSQWNDKISAIVIPEFEVTGDRIEQNMSREALARMALDKYPFQSNSVIVSGDADEIVRPEIIKNYRNCDRALWCQMDCYYYFLNCLCRPTPAGGRPVIAPLRVYQEIGFNRTRWVHGFTPITTAPMIDNAGWHFSYLGNATALKEKIGWAVEGHASDWVFSADADLIQDRIDQGKLYDGSRQFEFVDVDASMPKYVQENKDRLMKAGLLKQNTHSPTTR